MEFSDQLEVDVCADGGLAGNGGAGRGATLTAGDGQSWGAPLGAGTAAGSGRGAAQGAPGAPDAAATSDGGAGEALGAGGMGAARGAPALNGQLAVLGCAAGAVDGDGAPLLQVPLPWRGGRAPLTWAPCAAGAVDGRPCRSNCFHESGGKNPCHMSSNVYMIMFGITEVIFSQIPDFDQVWWLSIVAAIMSFTYSTVSLSLGIAQVAEHGTLKGSLTGISIALVTPTRKVWRSLQALGDIAFAYSYSIILIEIQDTIKSPPTKNKTMKKATLMSISVTTIFYLLCE